MTTFAEKLWGSGFASVMTVLVAITILASCFSMMLGYAEILCVAAREGDFFAWFGHKSETRDGLCDRAVFVFGVLACIGARHCTTTLDGSGPADSSVQGAFCRWRHWSRLC